MKHISFKKLALLLLALSISLAGCKKKEEPSYLCGQVLPSSLAGIWKSSYGDWYQFSATSYYYDLNYASKYSQGTITDVCDSGTSGFIIYKLTVDGYSAGNTGKYTVTKWKNKTATEVALSDAYNSAKPYTFNSASDAVKTIVNSTSGESEFFGYFGTFIKQ